MKLHYTLNEANTRLIQFGVTPTMFNLYKDATWYVLTDTQIQTWGEGYMCMFDMHVIDRLPTNLGNIYCYVKSSSIDDVGARECHTDLNKYIGNIYLPVGWMI